MGLEKKRHKIDEIDQRLVRLLEERLEVSLDIGAYKKEHGLPVLDRTREEEVVEKNLGRITKQGYRKYIKDLFNMVMSVSREAQRDIVIDEDTSLSAVLGEVPIAAPCSHPVVAYGGVRGSFGEEALLRYFGVEVPAVSCRTFDEVVEKVLEGSADYGVLPLENTTTGGILEVERLLEQQPVYITGEIVVPVAHCLLGLGELGEIKTVYSHPQGFHQSRDWLKDRGYEEIPYFNTAIAAEHVAILGDLTKGAIASRRAAEVYGLKVLVPDINYNEDNFTRFIILRNMAELEGNRDKISIQVILKDVEGSLFKVVKCISDHKLNMVKIASRPILGKPFEYIFSIDFNGSLLDLNVKKALREIREHSLRMNFKGNYLERKGRADG